jgi:4a-hydroxytetrahydrobiopterin dehydratase
MDMIDGARIAAAGLADWRKLAQGLHARFLVADLGAATRLLADVGAIGDALDGHARIGVVDGVIDIALVSRDAVYRDASGSEHVVEWVTEQDLELARRISGIAAEHGATADPGAVTQIELGLDSAASAEVAPVWAALLTGDASSQGRGSPSDEIRDAADRVPHLWFGGPAAGADRSAFHVEVYVAPEAVGPRVAAAVAAGGTVVDDTEAPGMTVIADTEGNRGVICADVSAGPGA